jgi:hypothetical protein
VSSTPSHLYLVTQPSKSTLFNGFNHCHNQWKWTSYDRDAAIQHAKTIQKSNPYACVWETSLPSDAKSKEGVTTEQKLIWPENVSECLICDGLFDKDRLLECTVCESYAFQFRGICDDCLNEQGQCPICALKHGDTCDENVPWNKDTLKLFCEARSMTPPIDLDDDNDDS